MPRRSLFSGGGPARQHWRRTFLGRSGGVLAATVLLFAAIALQVCSANWLTALDARISQRFDDAGRNPALTSFMQAVSDWHGLLPLVLYAALFCLWLMQARNWRWAGRTVVTVYGAMALNVVVKHLVARHRPDFGHPLLSLTTYSFPSGHTLGATVLYGSLAAFLLHRWAADGLQATAHDRPSGLRVATLLAIAAAMVAMVVLVACSRVYLGAHYPSDVIAAMLLGLAWLLFCRLLANLLWDRRATSSESMTGTTFESHYSFHPTGNNPNSGRQYDDAGQPAAADTEQGGRQH